jgi:dCMP deaminase
MSLTKWDQRFIKLAEHISTWSKDTSTKVGCIIVDERNRIVSTGYNGLPTGADDTIPERLERPTKYMFTEHAERNAIYTAANLGLSLAGKKLYISGELSVCCDCARAIIQTGIKEVFTPKLDKEKYPNWYDSNITALKLMEECGIKITFTNGEIDNLQD